MGIYVSNISIPLATTTFHLSEDPETQVGTLGPDSLNASTRPSLIPNSAGLLVKDKRELDREPILLKGSFLTDEAFQALKTDLTVDLIENTFGRYVSITRVYEILIHANFYSSIERCERPSSTYPRQCTSRQRKWTRQLLMRAPKCHASSPNPRRVSMCPWICPCSRVCIRFKFVKASSSNFSVVFSHDTFALPQQLCVGFAAAQAAVQTCLSQVSQPLRGAGNGASIGQ